MTGALQDLLGSRELWLGAAAALVAVSILALLRQRRPGLAAAAAIGAGAATSGVGSIAVAVLLVVAALVWPATDRSSTAILASVAAAGAVYVCVPDTERALVVLGAVAVVGAAAWVWRWPWGAAALVISLALAWVAVTDGSARPSAVVGSLGVAVVHQRLQARLPAGRPGTPMLVVGLVAMAVSARVAGMGEGTWRPVGMAIACVVLVEMAGPIIGARRLV